MTIQPTPEPSLTIVPHNDETPSTPGEPINLANPGFEDQTADGKPAGWDQTGTVEAVKLDDRGHSGDFRLTS